MRSPVHFLISSYLLSFPHFSLSFSQYRSSLNHVSLKTIRETKNLFQNSPRTFSVETNSRADKDDFELEAFSQNQAIPERVSFGSEAVPEPQRPGNEYLDLLNSPLFGWASSGNKGLLIRLLGFYGIVFALISFPIAGATFTQEGYVVQQIAAANVGTLSLVLALLVRLYAGWGYVGSRLSSDIVEYEETGWYDGAFEKKTKAERARDLFVYQNDVKPVVDRVKLFSFSIAGVWLASCIGLNVAISSKPMFNEYDANMLKELRYNEKLSDVAAQQSNGRPTYCDSRYYRAIANGGQGCK